MLVAVLASGSQALAAQLLDPILTVGAPEVSMTSADWAENYAGFQIPKDREPANWKFASHFAYALFPAEAIGVIGLFMAKAPTAEQLFHQRLRRRRPGASEPGGSAFAHRDALFYAEPGAAWGIRGGVPATEDPLTGTCLG